jgi:uncharacterized protein YndB with AHSA1/START domain
MKLNTREDVEAPIDTVFAALSDFDAIERFALRRGAAVERTCAGDATGGGRAWTVRFHYRGRSRVLTTQVERIEAPTLLASKGRIGGIEGDLSFDLTALSPGRTRVRVGLEMRPTTLTARLLLQSMRLAKTSLSNRFRRRVQDLARKIERSAR